jgi:hypothetical protein
LPTKSDWKQTNILAAFADDLGRIDSRPLLSTCFALRESTFLHEPLSIIARNNFSKQTFPTNDCLQSLQTKHSLWKLFPNALATGFPGRKPLEQVAHAVMSDIETVYRMPSQQDADA